MRALTVRCEWYEREPGGRCERTATVVLHVERPCGHPEGDAQTCPGHAEALAGETANGPSICRVCGDENSPFNRAETIRLLRPESMLLRRP